MHVLVFVDPMLAERARDPLELVQKPREGLVVVVIEQAGTRESSNSARRSAL